MTISAVGGGSAAQDIAAILRTSATSSSNTTQKANDGDADDTTSVSGPAALLDKLKSLEKSDPAKFKEVMAKISATLKTDAQSATDPKQQKMLTDMAAKFDAAGESGDLSGLVPGKGGAQKAGGHHHHHGGGAPPAAPPASGSTATQPADTNKDGSVSQAEQQAYDAAQAAKQGSSSVSARAYGKEAASDDHAKMAATMSQVMSIVDTAMSA